MRQVKRKSNKVEAPTMFIGVGGTGSKIVKKIYDLCTSDERENISFVCMDTNVNDLVDLRGDGNNIVLVQTSNTQTVGSYLDNDEDASKYWFPKNAVIYDKTVSEGAGQLRAISRLAFNSTIKTGKINALYDAIDSLFKKNTKEMKQALRICVVSTASGGTGSGMILPFCMFVRDYVNNKYPNASVILRTLILLPETLDSVITSNVERDSQRRNAYATIKEFNAFMMKGSGFCDIEESLKRYKHLHIDVTEPGRKALKKLSVLPCDFCFLLDGQNAEDATSNSFDQYKDQAALSLYEQNIGPMQKMAFSIEDNIIKELSNPGNYGRNRFGGIGAGRIIYPYEDIADYVAYRLIESNVGGDDAKWLQYDKGVAGKKAEDDKAEKTEDERTPVQEMYYNEIDSKDDKFTKNLRGHYRLAEADTRIVAFVNALKAKADTAIEENVKIQEAGNSVAGITGKRYDQVDNWASASSDFKNLNNYYEAVKKYAFDRAKSTVEGILYNDQNSAKLNKAGYLESIFFTNDNHFCHPNAARYMLCKLYMRAKSELDRAGGAVTEQEESIQDALKKDATPIEIKGKRNKTYTIDSLKTLCENANALRDESKNKKIYAKVSKLLNDRMFRYISDVQDLQDAMIEKALYQVLFDYVDRLNKQYEKFFGTFRKKSKGIERKKRDLVDRLKYKKGDSVLNVCCSEEILGELYRSSQNSMSGSELLDDALNEQIFDNIKKNVQIEKESELSNGLFDEDHRVDIFDEVLLKYFEESVRKDCKELDISIIQALDKQYRISKALKARENKDEDADEVRIGEGEIKAYIKMVLKQGAQISAPGIQRMVGEEAREINAAAYNAELKDMREYRMDELLSNGTPVDTVPKYEIHFFNALYNLTPDKLKKFSSPKKTDTGTRAGGLYHTAYTTYTRDIGPDCLKSSKMTTHIDRRWDSIAAMPELDLEYQQYQFLRTHRALVYGLLFNRIKKMEYLDDNSKVENAARAYRYINTNNHIEDMIVSNGTLCDEFYEILDSLYIDRALVENIYAYERKETAKDIMKRAKYEETKFYNYVKDFRILYEGEEPQSIKNTAKKDYSETAEFRSSLFEIPLAYYNSLPSYKHDEEELNSIVDAVIEVFRAQIGKYESEKNSKFVLCNEMKVQYDLLLNNYEKSELINSKISKSENKVLEIIERKVQDLFESSPQPEHYQMAIDNMKSSLNEGF